MKINFMSKQNKIFFLVVIILIAAGLILMARESKAPQDSEQQENNSQYQTNKVRPIDATDYVLGDPQALVQIIVYSDFECPFCAKFAETIKRVEENFRGKVAIAFRHYPLPGHLNAKSAAEAAECAAEQGKFWEMHDKLFADNTAGRMSQEQYKIDAADLGLNQEQFDQCLDSNKYTDKVGEQAAEGGKAGATGTPTFFANGYIYPGAYPFEDFTASDGRPEKGLKSIVDDLLK